jgi:tRNA threonylcarbamoyladenosine biosynthesis protein TsaB
MSSSVPAAPVLLALDTATDRIHAALSVGEAVSPIELPGGAQASTQLLPALGALLASAGKAWPEVDAIAFGRGPGAFTGLRTACSVTQGLALALGCPVIPLDTLMAVAEDTRLTAPQAWRAGDLIWVLQDARMDELYAGAFEWDGLQWLVAQPAQLWSLDEPVKRWATAGAATGLPRWAGNAWRAYPDRLACLAPGKATLADRAVGDSATLAPSAVPSGRALASLARAAWQRGDTADAALALPLYVRDKVAQTTAERQAAKATSGS